MLFLIALVFGRRRTVELLMSGDGKRRLLTVGVSSPEGGVEWYIEFQRLQTARFYD